MEHRPREPVDRIGWMTWALAATLVGVIIAVNGAIVVHEMAQTLEAQSHQEAPRAPWFAQFATGIAIAAMAAVAGGTAAPFYSWAKFRTASKPAPEGPQPDDEPDEKPLAPPGFAAGPVRTKRAGLAPLVGWNLVGVLVLIAGAVLGGAALATLEQTATFSGRGYRQAVLWAQLLRYAALPLIAIGSAALALAWGRWFPLGAVETVTTPPVRAASAAHWDRQG